MMDIFVGHGPTFYYTAIVGFLILTGGGLPIPEEVPIVAAGVLSSTNELNVYIAFSCCLVGALLGDMLVYGIGRYLGTSFFRRHPRFAHLLHEEREKQMERLIKSHGIKVFFVARFMVGVRGPIYLAAGVMRIPFVRFLIVDAICATMVVSVVFWLSYFYGEWVGGFIRKSQWGITILVTTAAIVVLLIFYFRRRRHKLLRVDGTDESEADSEDGLDTNQVERSQALV
jgi:membrane protein DedA with SNARE-associated domain